MNRTAPASPGSFGFLVAVAAAALSLAAPARAQEIVHPRTPSVSFRPTPLASELATLPEAPSVWFDPRLGIVTDASRRFAEITGERLPVVDGEDLRQFLSEERDRRRSRLWTARIAERLSGREREAQGLIPELENPLKVPAPLARVFGEGSDFDVQGKLHLSALGSRATQNPDLRSELLRQVVGGFDLDLDEILDLRILGTVGTKLDVAVDFNSSRELESKQLITATYTGTEDEIVKKVEAGDIRVLLPPSRFLGAGVARGTFGAQAVAQLGPVDLRFLGSRKEGQSSVRTLSIAPQGDGIEQEVTLDIKDTQFLDDRFFLLFHPDSLASQRLEYPNLGTQLANGQSTPTPGSLNVWLDDGNVTNNRENASKPGVARVDPTHPDTLTDQAHTGFFDLLVEGDDYVVTDQVIIQLKRQLDDTEVLAVSYETQGGTQVGSEQGETELDLKLIKPINPDTLDFTWDYTLRNVYSLREPEIQLTSLDLTIYRGNRDLKQTFESIDGESRKYVEIFGVSDANSRVNVPRVLRDPFGGSDYLVFPAVRPFFEPVDESGAVIPLERPNRNLYFNADGSRTALEDQVYFIEATYLSRGGISGEVELGAANIIEGSEEITMGGATLVRGTDYQIFYDFGRVVFSDPASLAERHPNQSIDISFEVAPLFNLAPTALWGASGTWALGEHTALNSTIVMQNQESLANRPILGSEPTRTLIGTVDGTWSRETPFLTRWLDALPGLETDEPSTFSVRGELAWSQPNPNTFGEVFLNDFENIDVAKRLSLFFRAWSLGSVPSQTDFDLLSVADARWYTFAAQSGEITPGSRGIDQGDNLFIVRLEPEGDTPGEMAASWRSIQSVISTTGEDLTRQEFIEFFARGGVGTITVDLGAVDEDRVRRNDEGIPVGIGLLDTEESNPDTRDNSLDVGEDTGLDGVSGDDAQVVVGDDGNDDFDERMGPENFPVNPNGTENNNVLDTEDDNFNGLLDRNEDALRWIVDLSDPRYEVPGSRNPLTGFRQFRLPLVTPDETLGNPDLRNVRAIRLTFSGVERTTEFEMARLEIVGSTFLKRGIVAADGTPLAGQDTDSLQIASINDIENPEYESPPGVVAQQDRADQVAGIQGVVVEQSLEFNYRGLPPGARGTIFRPLFDRESYIDYDRMRIWVQGRPTDTGQQPDFFVTFGLDTLNVYEYAAPLLEEDWEEHVIDFGVFTDLKEALLDSLDQAGAPTGTRISEDGRYRVRIVSTDTPPPTLTEVSQLTIGVDNTTDAPVTGTFWVDDWRLTEPLRDGGAARYVTARASVADFADIQFTYEGRNARYRNLTSAINNFTSDALDISARFALEKFLPESWGLGLPLTVDHFGREDAPLYRVGSDILLNEDAEREAQARTSDHTVVTMRAFRARQSSNPFLAATLDRLEGQITWRGQTSGSVDQDTDRGQWESLISYRNGFRKRGLPLGLGWLASIPWPAAIRSSDALQRLAGADLNLLPTNVTLTGRAMFDERELEKRIAEGRDFTADTTRNLQGDAQVAFQPFQSMRASIGLNHLRDLVFPETVVERGSLGVDAMRGQRFSFDWSPPIASWLSPRWSYTSDYARNHTRETSRSLDSLDLRDFSVTTNRTLIVDLELVGLIETFSGGGDSLRTASWWKQLFQPIRFDQQRQQSASYVQEEVDPGFGFTLGLGGLDDEGREDPQNLATNESWSVSTGLVPFEGMQLRAAYHERETARQYFSGTNSSAARTWPDVQLRWSRNAFPGFMERFLRSATLTSDFRREKLESGANELPLSDIDKRVWDPVVGITMTWGNGMSTDFRATTSNHVETSIRGGAIDSRREEDATDLTATIDYSIMPGTKIYLPFPTLWGVELQQPLRTSLTLARRYRESTTLLPGQLEGALNLNTATTEARPSVSYEFGRMVLGFAFSYLQRDDRKRDVKDTTTSMEAYLDFLF
jgi:hypothetical protein